ncbi:MAG: hypothetical protein LUE64_05205, partial [Candidatus Gastranaerophilales bacterium]|nr:hypothetical protein [Candidatus Gastranaerophilales bacterium]
MKTIFQDNEIYGANPWVYENNPCCNQIECVLNSSSPKNVKSLEFSKIEADFDAGDFSFVLLNGKKEEFKIPFFKNFRSINEIWDFLEKLCIHNTSQIMTLYRNNAETIIVCIGLPDNDIRFAVLNTLEYRLNDDGRYKYSYLNSKIDLDVIISK